MGGPTVTSAPRSPAHALQQPANNDAEGAKKAAEAPKSGFSDSLDADKLQGERNNSVSAVNECASDLLHLSERQGWRHYIASARPATFFTSLACLVVGMFVANLAPLLFPIAMVSLVGLFASTVLTRYLDEGTTQRRHAKNVDLITNVMRAVLKDHELKAHTQDQRFKEIEGYMPGIVARDLQIGMQAPAAAPAKSTASPARPAPAKPPVSEATAAADKAAPAAKKSEPAAEQVEPTDAEAASA